MSRKKKQYTIGIDIGGTSMKAILFDGEKVLADYSLGTPRDNLEHFMIMLQALVEPLIEKANELKIKVAGVGLGVAGWIDYVEEKMLVSPNIPLINGVKLGQLLSQRIELPVIMENDAACFVRAEALLGAGKKFNSVYGFTIGTGIGGGWCIDGKTFRGKWGGTGEPGRMIIDFNEGLQLENAYHKLTQNNPAQIAEEAYRGDVLAEKTFEEVGKYLGIAFANIVNIISPDIIIVGGGVIESSVLFLSTAQKTMKNYILSEQARKHVTIAKAKLGNHAGAIGAALLFS